ncbi:MAG: hypothetical protein HY058_11040 [Proteobacteria bacterium]|nr:hypothetical protein [Pseudomonadota bacterium]
MNSIEEESHMLSDEEIESLDLSKFTLEYLSLGMPGWPSADISISYHLPPTADPKLLLSRLKKQQLAGLKPALPPVELLHSDPRVPVPQQRRRKKHIAKS